MDNTQQGQVVGSENSEVKIDFTEFLGQQPTAPEVETPEEIIDLGDQQIPVSEVDNPKSYKFFQAKFSKEQQEKQKIYEEKIRLEAQLDALKLHGQPQANQVQVPQRPKPIPPMPEGFNLVDATTDPQSPSAQWYAMKLNYDMQKAGYDEYFQTQIEQDRQATLQERQLAQQKAQAISRFQEVGATPETAVKVHDWVTNILRNDDFDTLYKAYTALHSQPNPQVQERVAQMQKMNGQQGIPLPPTAIPSKAVPSQENFGKELLELTKQYRI